MPDLRTRQGLLALWRVSWPFWLVIFFLWALFVVGKVYLWDFVLDLGSANFPSQLDADFMLAWSFFGAITATFLCLGLLRLGALAKVRRVISWVGQSPNWPWIVFGSLAAFLVPAMIRAFILKGAPLTDDESAYRFFAQLLSTFRLHIPSPPMKSMYDNAFLINDGKLYPQYFFGWPLMMVPGVYLGITGYMNAIYSALSVFPLYDGIRRLTDARYAKLGLLIYLSAPMLMVAAATEMSHTTCIFALIWMHWFLLRAQSSLAWTWSLGFSISFCLAFVNRPLTALGIGLPLLVVFAGGLLRLPRTHLRQLVSAFSIPALVFAALFLGVNQLQNGSPWVTGYARYVEYAHRAADVDVGWSRILDLPDAIATVAVGFLRLNFAAFGWPVLFVLFLPLAFFVRKARLPFWSLVVFFGLNLFVGDPGIDTFGPVHFTEAGWPALLLVVLVLHHFETQVFSKKDLLPRSEVGFAWQGLTFIVAFSMVLLSLMVYSPLRLNAINIMAKNIRKPVVSAQVAGIHNAVVFVRGRFTQQREIYPTRHWVHAHPIFDPDFKDDVLWLRLQPGVDQEMVERYFPGRAGYLMEWERNGVISFAPLPK